MVAGSLFKDSSRAVAATMLLLATGCAADSSTAPKLDSRALLFQIANALYTVDPDGTGQRQLTDGTHFDGFGAWSPDGSQIAFTSSRDGQDELYTMRADGSAVVRVTTPATNPGSLFMVSWS